MSEFTLPLISSGTKWSRDISRDPSTAVGIRERAKVGSPLAISNGIVTVSRRTDEIP